MRNKFERILLSILLGISVLLGLSFWLNTIFGFNLFFKEHWQELAKLQAEHIPISKGFYISIGVAIFIFVFGLCFIYIPAIKRVYKKNVIQSQQVLPTTEPVVQKNETVEPLTPKKEFVLPTSRPPRLNLPSNMAQIIKQQYSAPEQQPSKNTNNNNSESPYTATFAQIFQDNGYTVKNNPKIAGFTPNLFAIAPNEILWIGAADCDIDKLQSAINKLKSIFQETLEDIQININAFILDTTSGQQTSDSIFIFKSLEELKKFVSELPPVRSEEETDADKENFDAYSEYIDTIIQYLKTMGQ